MGNSASKPADGSTLKDTTYRSIVFGRQNFTMKKGPNGITIDPQVSASEFQTYMGVLNRMARLSRAVYCDTSILWRVLLDSDFQGTDNKVANEVITKYDSMLAKYKRTPTNSGAFPNSMEGRPMLSYVIDDAPVAGPPFCQYVSSPDDLTFMILKGEKAGLQATDAVLCFKGSSSVANFKHDLMSQFTPVNLETKLPPGLSMTSKGNTVPGSFLQHILDSWNFITSSINTFKPTRLFVTGHSLGGAYASLFTFIAAETKCFPGISAFHLVTFGAPTVLSDTARNTFNTHLDSGFVTLDRVVASGIPQDFIPTIPAGFSHPGYQPLRTEIKPEATTGRAYQIQNIKKVFQQGGAIVLGLTQAKRDYANASLTHIPNLIKVPTSFAPFSHGGYLDMTFLGGFRLYGMKNPGFKGNTFIANLGDSGVSFEYAPSSAPPVPDSDDKGNPATELQSLVPKQGGKRRTSKNKLRRYAMKSRRNSSR